MNGRSPLAVVMSIVLAFAIAVQVQVQAQEEAAQIVLRGCTSDGCEFFVNYPPGVVPAEFVRWDFGQGEPVLAGGTEIVKAPFNTTGQVSVKAELFYRAQATVQVVLLVAPPSDPVQRFLQGVQNAITHPTTILIVGVTIAVLQALGIIKLV